MQKTIKLYLNDSLRSRCKSKLLWSGLWQEQPAVVFDQTVFYGEAGGQLADRGVLQNGSTRLEVIDVQIENGVYYHLLKNTQEDLPTGSSWDLEIELERRLDHMRQHTGQHLLSGVFSHRNSLRTVSSRLGSKVSTIDIPLENPDWNLLERAENDVNRLIMDNRRIHIHYPDAEGLKKMPLRRTPKVEDDIRVIEVEDFDFTPCGGTHCRSTGEVGLLKILNQERYKGMVRVSFVAGRRAVVSGQNQAREIREVVRKTECQIIELPNLIKGIKEDLHTARQELGIFRKAYLEQFANTLLLDDDHAGQPRWIPVLRDSLDAASRRVLASLLTKQEGTVTAIVSREKNEGKWMFLLSANPSQNIDLAASFKAFFGPLGGRGGGRSHHIEGFLPPQLDVEDLLAKFKQHLGIF